MSGGMKRLLDEAHYVADNALLGNARVIEVNHVRRRQTPSYSVGTS